MSSNSLNIGILVRLFLFALIVVILCFSLYFQHWIYVLPALLLLGLSTWNLVYFVNSTNRTLTYFVEGIRNEDSTLHFPETANNKTLQRLHKSLNQINKSITDIKIRHEQHERFFLEFLKHSATGLVVVDESGFISIANAKALNFCGLPYLSHLQRLEQSNKLLYEAIRQLEPGQSRTLKWQEGSELQQLSLKVVTLQFRDKRYRICSLHDIRAELEENELETWQKLIRVLTHEIMNSIAPITSISNTLSRFYTKNGQPAKVQDITQQELDNTRQGLAVIEERGEGLIQFVDSYRTLAKVPKPTFKEIDIRKWLERIEVLVRSQLESEEIELSIQHQHSQHSFPGDEKLLTQVILNLLNNAVDALADKGQKKIHIQLSETPDSRLKIAIIDNGKGFSQEESENLFIPFYTTKEHGSGIGLSLSRQIMRLHKGSISAHSVPGVETRVEVVV